MRISIALITALMAIVVVKAVNNANDPKQHTIAVCNDDRASPKDCIDAFDEEMKAHPYVEDNDFSHEDEAQSHD